MVCQGLHRHCISRSINHCYFLPLHFSWKQKSRIRKKVGLVTGNKQLYFIGLKFTWTLNIQTTEPQTTLQIQRYDVFFLPESWYPKTLTLKNLNCNSFFTTERLCKPTSFLIQVRHSCNVSSLPHFYSSHYNTPSLSTKRSNECDLWSKYWLNHACICPFRFNKPLNNRPSNHPFNLNSVTIILYCLISL